MRRTERRVNLLDRAWRTGVVALTVAGLLATAARAGTGPHRTAFVPARLLAAAHSAPRSTFRVIVQGADGQADLDGGKLRKRLRLIDGVAAQLTGAQLAELARQGDVRAITPDAPVVLDGRNNPAYSAGGYSNDTSLWPSVADVKSLWSSTLPAPTIAIVDSGIDASSRADFRNRVLAQVDLCSLTPNSPGDGRGHGTFVASIAAGSARGHAGAAPNAKLVSIDVMNDDGEALTSDVIAAADWIARNKDRYGIRVANFSLHSSRPSSFTDDPLDKAVENLWFKGVVVVTAAGNYAVDGKPSGVLYAPANDPFVLTVGVVDFGSTLSPVGDFPAPWSAYGYTPDGFAKPELLAPGRYIMGAVPPASQLPALRPDRVNPRDPAYMTLSGTSFAAPIVAGAAADILARHPTWTPDQVKGALMATARAAGLNASDPLSLGAGEVDAAAAAQLPAPPNPNRALDGFLVSSAPDATPTFDAAAWHDTATADPNWDAVSWSDVSWDSVAWSDVSWDSAAMSDVAWDDVAWSDESAEALTWVW
jgi:serine protease AprX